MVLKQKLCRDKNPTAPLEGPLGTLPGANCGEDVPAWCGANGWLLADPRGNAEIRLLGTFTNGEPVWRWPLEEIRDYYGSGQHAVAPANLRFALWGYVQKASVQGEEAGLFWCPPTDPCPVQPPPWSKFILNFCPAPINDTFGCADNNALTTSQCWSGYCDFARRLCPDAAGFLQGCMSHRWPCDFIGPSASGCNPCVGTCPHESVPQGITQCAALYKLPNAPLRGKSYKATLVLARETSAHSLAWASRYFEFRGRDTRILLQLPVGPLPGSTVQVVGTLDSPETGGALAGREVQVKINGVLASPLPTTDVNGVFVVQQQLGPSPGAYLVEATFTAEDEDAWEASSAGESFTTSKLSTALSIVIEPKALKVGEAAKITGLLQDQNGVALANAPVQVLLGGTSVLSGESDQDGIYEDFLAFDAAGQFSLRLRFAGDDSYEPSESESALVTVTEEAPPPPPPPPCGDLLQPCCPGGNCKHGLVCVGGRCQAAPPPPPPPPPPPEILTTLEAFVTPGDFTIATAKLLAQVQGAQVPVAEVEVFFQLDGLDIASGFTNAEGLVTREITSVAEGEHMLKVSFPGAVTQIGTLGPSEAVVEFVVERSGGGFVKALPWIGAGLAVAALIAGAALSKKKRRSGGPKK